MANPVQLFNKGPSKDPHKPRLKARMDELIYNEVTLIKEDFCGSGAYGRVCKAMVDQLVCAAKIIHPTFFREIDPSTTKTIHQFERECDFLSAIRHPCIVQYLGTVKDTETGLPVLLMELMDESLTKFLERTFEQGELVPYHIQVNFCHDISMALAFLHSNGIIHRDLSSNNVLLVAGSKAKVTDFGMSKLVDRFPRVTPLTQCPGTLVYMPPEALRTPSNYTVKLDVFSFGVCVIQVITCRFPNPGDAKRTVMDSRHGPIEVPIPEEDRRRSDIEGIPRDNFLLATALDCLADKGEDRPSFVEICYRMVFYKSDKCYSDSIEQVNSKKHSLRDAELKLKEKSCEIETLLAEITKKEKEMETVQDLYEREVELNREKDNEISRLRDEMRRDTLTPTSSTGSSSLRRSKSPLNLGISEEELENLSFNKMDSFFVEEQLSLEVTSSSLWYHGPISRTSSCQRLETVGSPGAFLIRESCSVQGSLVLSFLDRDRRIHHFKIVKDGSGQYNIGGNIWFSSLSKLVGFHSKYSSVVEKYSERLDVPVAPPSPVPLPDYVLF